MPKEMQTLEGDLHHEVTASEDGGGESNPWDTNLFYNMNLNKMETMNSLMKRTLRDSCKMNKMLHQKAI